MVVVLDLEGDRPDDPLNVNGSGYSSGPAVVARTSPQPESEEDRQRPNPNIGGFSAVLSCYPIVSQIARSIDLNTLHSLSRTCRQIRANIDPYRRQLVTQTLRCHYDDVPFVGFTAVLTPSLNPNGHRTIESLRRGKVARCARDLVAECRRCATVVCRNCTIKPPPSPSLVNRHRRLCPTCHSAPLIVLMLTPGRTDVSLANAFTSEAFKRTPCSCPDSVWLCQPCGLALRSADTTYQRVWTWRTRYSTYLGGIGTGIGEGNEGVKCGRGENCLAMQVIDVELDCDAEDMAALLEDDGKGGKAGIVKGIGYLRQEIEGIGGFLKKKIKKRVKLGAPVEEWEDEREKAQYLAREARGDERSWCGWCSRVIPGKDDEDESKTPRRRSGVRKVPSYQAYP